MFKTKSIIFSSLIMFVLIGYIIYGFAVADFWEEGSKLMSLVWGQITIADLYAGLILFSLWIWYREHWVSALFWTIALFTLGFSAACMFVIVTAVRSDNDPVLFFTGRAHETG